jgi:hypothetical protein
MNPDGNAESGKSKADSFQSQTPAMKAWKKKYIEGEKSDDESSVSSSPIENFSAALALSNESKEFWAGFMLLMTIYLPLSIISYFNESINGYFCFGGWDCAPPPPYYHLPRLIALVSTGYFLGLALNERGDSGNHGVGYAKGIFLGVVFGVLMFIFFSGAGWVQE